MGNAAKRSKITGKRPATLHLQGVPNERQRLFFASRAKYTAYGGARGGGKSWALRRKLILLCLNYPGITCLVIRRSYPELRQNHILPLQRELGEHVLYRESEKCFLFPGEKTSRIFLGHLSSARDILRYQGQEYDIIAIDEATQLTEEQFSALKACLRGTNSFPKRMYLTCNPGGVGHAWVKRLFVDRDYRDGEVAADYLFIPAKVYDNAALLENSPDYLAQLQSLPERLRKAWLEGSWNVFEGQFFSEFREESHVIEPFPLQGDGAPRLRFFAAMDYGFDMLALLLLALDEEGRIYAVRERAAPGLTLSMAARELSELTRDFPVEYVAASPDLWNRRQDTGYSGFEIIRGQEQQGVLPPLPPLFPADNRRVEGWRALRETLHGGDDAPPRLRFFAAMDYGFDMLALLLLAMSEDGQIYVVRERAVPGLTLSMAARELSEITRDFPVEYVAASPDLWNRRQDTGYSGFEIIRGQEQQGVIPPLPLLYPADNRRVEGWRALREVLHQDGETPPRLRIFSCCPQLIRCLPALVTDMRNPEDASSHPHSVTHLPEALRYGIMSRMSPPEAEEEALPAFFHRGEGRKSVYAY